MIALLLYFGHTSAQVKTFTGANWISSPDSAACPVFKKRFLITKSVRTAILFITAHGLYEAAVNQKKVGEAYFTPGWTDYAKRLQYQSYYLKQLKRGDNNILVTLSAGWYSGVFGEDMKQDNYGKGTALLAQLIITYQDGTQQVISSGADWLRSTGNIRYSDFYNGEVQDERVRPENWKKVTVENFNKTSLLPTISEPVTGQETFRPKRIFKDSKNETIIDFGQNLAGLVKLRIKGKPGDTVTIAHAEMLDEKGNFYTGNLRDAKATDVYVLNGKPETVHPHFTYHGFRYAKVTGFIPSYNNCVAIAVHTNLKHTGTFSCSNPMLNQLQHNIEWSLNSNFVDIPTDCPQRSERFGWTGDAQVFCATAPFNRYTLNFYKKYLADIKADQGTNGAAPVVIPDFEQQKDTIKQGVAGWGDAATIIPWNLYQVYGDKTILKEQYNSMKGWVDYITAESKNNLWTTNGYGDWYAPGPKTALPFIDQCFWAYSTQLLLNTAKILGKDNDAKTYEKLLGRIKTAFQKTYKNKDTTQTACILELQFDMLAENKRQYAADKLAVLIKINNNHLATGFLGTPYLLPVLTRFGYTKLCYTLLLQQTCPSWLYPITKGATTIWERWDGIKPDGTIQQTSFNHYAYGAVGQWLYEDMLGIRPALPGYKTINIQPHPDSRLKWAKGSYACAYGKIVSEWKIIGSKVSYHIIIPKNTMANIELAGQKLKRVNAGDYHFITTNNVCL